MKFLSAFLVCSLFFLSTIVRGQELITTAQYPFTTMSVGSEMAIADPLYIAETPVANYKVDRRFRVELNYNRNNHTDLTTGNKWTLSVTLNNPTTGQNETLLLEHTPTGTAKYVAWADFTGTSTNMNWKITAITVQKWNGSSWIAGTVSDLPAQDIHFEVMVFNDRIVQLGSEIPKLSLNGNVLEWNYVTGAVEYDVEWVFIGEFDNFTYNALVPSGPFDFKEPVRITTYKHRHELDLIYPIGTVYYRIRPKGYFFRSGDKEVYYTSTWSYVKKAGSGNMSYSVTTDFEALKTWQYTVAYAENGMAMSTVTYFDGSLRARQQLSQMNTTGQVVAAATLYDYEGRQTVQVIPTPINTNSLNYFNNLHKDVAGNAFDKDDFDLGTSNPMGTTSGAGMYYSSANNLTNDPYRDRIPDAEGYPYSQVSFINDNTGRPRKSSGVGLTHKMGGTHETVYYYVKPTERDLRELFGSNVGDVSHYDKQVVVDPNGQASVTYTDQFGRVIAAGLMGGAPNNLVALDNNPAGVGATVTANLMPGNQITTDANGNLQSVTDYYQLNIGTNPITLNYDLVSGGINTVDALFGTTGCASCFYELEIQVYDPSGNLVNLGYTSQTIAGSPLATIREKYAASALNCESPSFDPTLTAISKVVSLTLTGEYRIRKILRVDQQAVATYLATNASTLPGAPSLAAITGDYLANVVITGCGLDCAAFYEQECREELGYPITGLLTSLTTPQQDSVTACINEKCAASVAEIENTTDPDADKCTMLLETFRQDLAPGGWVFEEDLAWRLTSSNWALSYPVSTGGTFTPTTWADLVNNWELGWEDVILAAGKHPENCQYAKCTTLAVIDQYITDLNSINSWADALSGNYITTAGNIIGTNDPLSTHAMYSTTFGAFITTQNTNYSGTGLNILAAVNSLILTNPDLVADPTTGLQLPEPELSNRKWLLLRSLYLGARQVFVEDGYTGCAYYDNPSANFIDPDDMVVVGNNAPVYDNTPNADCADICNNNVSYWMSRIADECKSVTPTQLQTIQGYLQNYCLTDCDGLANEYGAIQISDLIAGNTQLAAVQSILQLSCTFNLSDLAIDDTCSNPVTVSVENLDIFTANLVKNLAILGSLSATNHSTFITMPSIVANAADYPLSYWQSGMYVQLTNTSPASSVTYNISDLSSISVVNQTITGSVIKFVVDVQLINGTHFQHTINNFNLSKVGGGVIGYPINTISSKEQRTYTICDDDVSPFEIDFSLQDWIDDCIDDIQEEANTLAEVQYAHELENFLNGLTESFSTSCFGTGMQEQFSITYDKKEYAFTLYYYDQAGNLVQTVPPQGVHIVPTTGFNAQGTWLGTEPEHFMKTMYTYNSLNQLTKSETPDGGIAQFWYNSAQQLRFSQNAAQLAQNKYSFSKFDALGRSIEAGVFTEATFSNLLTGINDNTFPVAGTAPGTYNLYEVVRSYYHKQTLTLDAALGWSPKDLNNRIAAIAYYDVITGSGSAYSNALFYDYDIHGNVKHLLTDLNIADLGTQRYKTVDYTYDLYSGKMLEVAYQATKEDQFLHRYTYDDDNRITGVKTSRDGVQWDEDASYYYYLHGPLARVELGDNKVQGIDYAYTVHGWLKGVNDNTLTARRDLGKDGSAQNTANKWVAQDAFGYSLTYFNATLLNGTIETDYKPIVTPTADANWLAANEAVILPTSNTNLYNGNIRAMVTAIRGTNNFSIGTVARVYKYDQLQRIKEAQTWKTGTGNGDLEGNNSWTGAITTTAHYSSYQYDLNGNITKLQRRGNTADMDDFTYNYYSNDGGSPTLPKYKNQLAQVSDALGTDANFTDDVNSGQLSDNYIYDALGRLTRDKQENIFLISWNVQNKVTYIQRDAGSLKSDVGFKYNAFGERIAKIVYPKLAGGSIDYAGIKSTYYALDASGNVMATYSQVGNAPTTTFLEDFEVYGASRLGTQTADVTLASAPNFNFCSDDNRASAIVELKLSTFTNGQSIQYKVGTTVLNAVYSWNTGITIEQNAALLMKEINKNTVTTDVSASPWWSNNASGTLYMELKYSQPGNWKGQTLAVYVNGVLGGLPGHQPKRAMGYGTCRGNDIVGAKSYELANHLGNVLAVISDRKWAVDDGVYNTTTGIKTSSTADGLADYYTATVVSYSDYDPFGTVQDGRKGNENSYRFGYQGSEKDDEIKGGGNSYTTTNRLLDPRIGRWFTTDPINHPWQSPYSSMDNNPISHNDPLGLSTSGKDKKPKTYSNPEKQARKDAKSRGLNGNNSRLTQYSDGSILVQRRIVGDDGSPDEAGGGAIGIEKMYYRSSKWGTRQFHNQQVRDKARADANQTSIMGQLWGDGQNWHKGNRYTDNPATALLYKGVRANMAAIDNFVEGCMYTAVAVCTGGAIGLELYGSGVVSTELSYIQKALVTNKAKIYSGLIGGSTNFVSQYVTTGGDYSKMDQASIATSVVTPFIPVGPYMQGIAGGAVDATIDYSSNGGLQTPFGSGLRHKNADVVVSDFVFVSLGNMGGSSFRAGDLKVNHKGWEILATGSTCLFGTIINASVNDQLNK